ncbi:glutathione peroxidase [Ammoniphilus sp. YIM 78166]|uniref:glutathione peroxidase n=1 Tax=Ammoniphilus sp. YIM 78166 TaxID=1644106 RepID=UPI00106F3BEA|nr:glutathione peroxidase [Ammoniphilus sp. YIM 78166]
MSIYSFSAKTLQGQDMSLVQFQGKVILIVNTASKCGFTPQYKGLQELYEQYKDQGFVVLGFPSNQFGAQEPGSEDEIAQFCEQNYGVSFPMFAKVEVKGDQAHPLFTYLSERAPGILGTKQIKWNFTKFLVNKQGEVVNRFAPNTNPQSLQKEIESLL